MMAKIKLLVIIIFGGCVSFFICTIALNSSGQERRATQAAEAVLQAATDDAMGPTYSAQTKAAQATHDADATNFALTPPTETPTVTDTARPSATATITDTSEPSPTSPPSDTPVPAIEITPIEPVVYYVTGTANVRTCPSTDCDALGQYRAGQGIGVDGATVGEAVNGNQTWYRTMFQAETGYIHSSLISFVAPAPTRAPVQQQSSGQQPISTPVPQPAQQWVCSGDIYNCDSFSSRAEMRSYWESCPGDPSNLDGNNDGEYCE